MYTKRKIFALVCGVLLVVSIGLNIGLLNQNQNLREQMNQLQSAQIQMTMRINDLSGEISDLSAQLTAENSLLADSEVTVEIDADKHLTADISVIPKEIGLEDSVREYVRC